MSLPNPGILRVEISQLSAQRKELANYKEGLCKARDGLYVQRAEILKEMLTLYKTLEDSSLPGNIKGQLQERIALMQNAKISLGSQIRSFQDRISVIDKSGENITSGITVRKDLLTRLIGSISQQSKASQQNRELGRIKG